MLVQHCTISRIQQRGCAVLLSYVRQLPSSCNPQPLKGCTAEVYNAVSLLLLALALYCGLYLAIGGPFLPSHGPAWAIIFIWFCATVLGFGLDRVRLCHMPWES